MALGLAAQHEKRGGDAVFFQHVQQMRGVYRRTVIKGEGAQVLTHGLIHDDITFHHTCLRRLGSKPKCKKAGYQAYLLEKKSHFSCASTANCPEQKTASPAAHPLCCFCAGSAKTAAFSVL
jgi:hypothetical protein